MPEPFGGRFLVHGGEVEVVESTWPGHLIVIEFPDIDHVRGWYNSPGYQAMLKLRTDNSQSDVVFVVASGIHTRPPTCSDS